MSAHVDVDVLVAGGGQAGLFLAAELRLAGISVTVVEAEKTFAQTGPHAVRGLSWLTMRTFRMRDLERDVYLAAWAAERARSGQDTGGFDTQGAADASELIASMWPNGAMKAHFALLPVIDRANEYPDVQLMPMPYAELQRILAARTERDGARVLWGRRVERVEQDEESATAILDDGTQIRARYLVAADGGRSTVRSGAGFEFPGDGPTLIARGGETVILDDPHKLPLGISHLPTGTLAVGAMRGHLMVTEYDVPDDQLQGEATATELEASLQRVSGTDVRVVGLEHPFRFTDNARQVSRYRQGRVLVVGDAAHVHPPYGAQGLNLGIQDAANLGWKLAQVIRGQSDEELLDTVTEERHPVAARVLKMSRAQVPLLRIDQHATALREVFAELIELPEVRHQLMAYSHGMDIRYPIDGEHPAVGRFASGLPDEARAGTIAGGGVLLDPKDEFGAVAAEWPDRVHVVPASDTGHPGTALLVRPDGFVAWADGNLRSLRAALLRWFGAPS